jgi:peptide/nickel transport system ATP-binding protein
MMIEPSIEPIAVPNIAPIIAPIIAPAMEPFAVARPLLKVEHLEVCFDTWNGRTKVLDDVSFHLNAGETLCIVGESGCGKSMTALALMGLIPQPDGHITGGKILYRDQDLIPLHAEARRQMRGNALAMIFQEPMSSLNPVYPVGEQIAEVLRIHKGMTRKDAHDRAIELLRQVRIPEAERRVREFPHQFSGGMRQRVMIAIALACNPAILIADEPTTALDVTVQAQIFDLLQELREEHNTALILITHDMGAVAELADRVLVMYAGRKVEEGLVDDILLRPAHPYTRGLLHCRPTLKLGTLAPRQELPEIPGVVPPLYDLPPGCAFAPRCSVVQEQCLLHKPNMLPALATLHRAESLMTVESNGSRAHPHQAACVLLAQKSPESAT